MVVKRGGGGLRSSISDQVGLGQWTHQVASFRFLFPLRNPSIQYSLFPTDLRIPPLDLGHSPLLSLPRMSLNSKSARIVSWLATRWEMRCGG